MKDVRLRAFELNCQYPNAPRSVIITILRKEGYNTKPIEIIPTLRFRRSSTKRFEAWLRKQLKHKESP